VDRSQARSAWDSATQKRRPVGYGLIRAGVRTNGSKVSAVNKRQAGSLSLVGVERRWCEGEPERSRISYRTLRDGSLGGRCPGTSCQATIMLSLWDGIHSPRRGFDKLALKRLKPRAAYI
jgi:hypothetical protein